MNFLLLFLFIVSLSLYFPLNQRRPKFDFMSRLDKNIPLIPQSVWIYATYYILLPASIISIWIKDSHSNLLLALTVSILLSCLIWWQFPNGVKRPTIKNPKSASQKILAHIFSSDKDSNVFPSGHISLSIISTYYLCISFPSIILPVSILCIAICISTLTTKQHYLFDYVFTVPLTITIIQLTQHLS